MCRRCSIFHPWLRLVSSDRGEVSERPAGTGAAITRCCQRGDGTAKSSAMFPEWPPTLWMYLYLLYRLIACYCLESLTSSRVRCRRTRCRCMPGYSRLFMYLIENDRICRSKPGIFLWCGMKPYSTVSSLRMSVILFASKSQENGREKICDNMVNCFTCFYNNQADRGIVTPACTKAARINNMHRIKQKTNQWLSSMVQSTVFPQWTTTHHQRKTPHSFSWSQIRLIIRL